MNRELLEIALAEIKEIYSSTEIDTQSQQLILRNMNPCIPLGNKPSRELCAGKRTVSNSSEIWCYPSEFPIGRDVFRNRRDTY